MTHTSGTTSRSRYLLHVSWQMLIFVQRTCSHLEPLAIAANITQASHTWCYIWSYLYVFGFQFRVNLSSCQLVTGLVSCDMYVYDSVLGLLVFVLVLLGLLQQGFRLERSFKATSYMYLNHSKTKMICILVFFNYHFVLSFWLRASTLSLRASSQIQVLYRLVIILVY